MSDEVVSITAFCISSLSGNNKLFGRKNDDRSGC
jgi:hypothetical protein